MAGSIHILSSALENSQTNYNLEQFQAVFKLEKFTVFNAGSILKICWFNLEKLTVFNPGTILKICWFKLEKFTEQF